MYDERLLKLNRIDDFYSERNTQDFIAKKFKMNINDVRKATKICDYVHTRKKTIENLKEGETINPIIRLDELEFLDKYDLKNFYI